ncbi:hypothetical protein ACIBBE_07465 [Streptomyces sp. NPDC051644]|uniref:hypothetical protein n=1 Tax=Streptomyces sp. NPDC051644 TaxID=3365666 RepID=UPI00378D8693
MSRSTRTSGNSRVLLRTATASLSTLSFLVCGASPAHAHNNAEQVHPSCLESLRPGATADVRHIDRTIAAYRVDAIEKYPKKHFSSAIAHDLT